MAITEADIHRARVRGRAKSAHMPPLAGVRFDPVSNRLVLCFETGVELHVPIRAIEGLEGASAEDLAQSEISPSGLGLHFPALDADLYLPALLEGVMGTKAFMAAQMGRLGGKAISEAKAKAARENGRKGGRPKAGTAKSAA